jgi:hypothetical protein
MNTSITRCLSIRQPWASLIVSGVKPIENRTWPTDYRGVIAIHASGSKAYLRANLEALTRDGILPAGNDTNMAAFHFGAIVGVAEIADCLDYYDDGDDWDRRRLRSAARAAGIVTSGAGGKRKGHAVSRVTYFANGPLCWLLRNAVEFAEPITPVLGKLNLWRLSPEQQAAVAEAMQHPLPVGSLPRWPKP